MVTKYLNFSKSLNIFLFFLLNLLFSFNCILYAQNATPTIVLKVGAKLFSSDKSFNEQILTNKVFLNNVDVSIVEHKNKKQFLRAIARQSKTKENDLTKKLIIAQDDKRREALKKLKKGIEDYEKRKKDFQHFDFEGVSSQKHFFSSNTLSKDYMSPNRNNHDLSKFNTLSNAYLIVRALDFLHAQKFVYYNNKSLTFCFSEVFSVRPPPFVFATQYFS